MMGHTPTPEPTRAVDWSAADHYRRRCEAAEKRNAQLETKVADLTREANAAAKELERRHAEIRGLRAYIADQLCECRDEYGVEFPTPCERCVVLGLKAAKAAGGMSETRLRRMADDEDRAGHIAAGDYAADVPDVESPGAAEGER